MYISTANICFLLLYVSFTWASDDSKARWCVVTDAELYKCQELILQLNELKNLNVPNSDSLPEFLCIRGTDVFDCMQKIQDDNADLITLDSGQGYYAGRYHNMIPIMAENYLDDPNAERKYFAVAVTRRNENIDKSNLEGKRVCFPGIGMSAGWLYPISKMLKLGHITVAECNAIVKTVDNFFGDMCLPGSLSSFYNPFGNNPTSVCKLCQDKGADGCTASDPYAGFDGAFKCLSSGAGQLAFLKGTTVREMISMASNNSEYFNEDDFELLCPNSNNRPVNEYESCNWGRVPAHVVMTSGINTVKTVETYVRMINEFYNWFGPNKQYTHKFKLFGSEAFYPIYGRANLMFSDTTKRLEVLDDKHNSYYTYVDTDFIQRLDLLNECPMSIVRWCVTSDAEQYKCENMMMAFMAKDLRPQMDCLQGGSTTNCMELIRNGDADLMAVDAADVYLAGKKYGLVPVAAEDYGDSSMAYKVVAAARKTDKQTTLFNMKNKRACLPGIGRGDGWVIPLNIFIETEQFLPGDCSIFENLGQLFSRSCIPGALDLAYNPKQFPISLCEGCAAGGFRKCQRNSEEQYYGASGSFRCLVEKGGDVSFVRHLTVSDNTDGRNHAIWARNRRSDDYELMCKDGRRVGINFWKECYLGIVPANAIIAAGHSSARDRVIFWNLLNFGQQFFSSDIDGDFHMFDSGTYYTDLIFTDAAVRIMKIDESRQTYVNYLGADFIAQIENLQKYTCVSTGSATAIQQSVIVLVLSFILYLTLS